MPGTHLLPPSRKDPFPPDPALKPFFKKTSNICEWKRNTKQQTWCPRGLRSNAVPVQRAPVQVVQGASLVVLPGARARPGVGGGRTESALGAQTPGDTVRKVAALRMPPSLLLGAQASRASTKQQPEPTSTACSCVNAVAL